MIKLRLYTVLSDHGMKLASIHTIIFVAFFGLSSDTIQAVSSSSNSLNEIQLPCNRAPYGSRVCNLAIGIGDKI